MASVPVRVHLDGAYLRNSRQRLIIDGTGADSTGTFYNQGPDPAEHSANADFSSATSIAAAAVSGTISTRRYVRSVGRSKLVLYVAHESPVV